MMVMINMEEEKAIGEQRIKILKVIKETIETIGKMTCTFRSNPVSSLVQEVMRLSKSR